MLPLSFFAAAFAAFATPPCRRRYADRLRDTPISLLRHAIIDARRALPPPAPRAATLMLLYIRHAFALMFFRYFALIYARAIAA